MNLHGDQVRSTLSTPNPWSFIKTSLLGLAVVVLVCAAVLYGPALYTSFMGLSVLMQIGVFCIVLAFIFDFVNGFHDTANAVATVIYSGALPAWFAILMSASLNFAGAVTVGTSVAHFIATTIPLSVASPVTLLATLLAGLCWNIVTWWRGLPVSSTHCLLGSLAGAGFAVAGMDGFSHPAVTKALVAMIVSPALGFVLALCLAWLMNQMVRLVSGDKTTSGQDVARRSKSWRFGFRALQVASSASVSFTHGANDGQKTMGLITLILATTFASQGYTVDAVPLWVQMGAALAIGLGTAIGGGRIIKTVGEHLSTKSIDPIQGCAAEFMTALTVLYASKLGVPASTTHVLTSGVVGSSMGLHGTGHTKWITLRKIGMAWLITLPVTAALAFGLAHLLKLIFV